MSTEQLRVLDIDGIPVAFVRKRVRYLRMTVNPPDGDVRVSVPWHVSGEEAVAFVRERMDWVRSRRDAMRRAPRPASSRCETGETVELFGNPIPLRVLEMEPGEPVGTPRLDGGELLLPVRQGAGVAARKVVLDVWLRARLSEKLSALVARWTAAMGERPVRWDIRRMRTRWGSCAARKRFLRFNWHLVRVPERCVEYVVVHELAHLREQNHSSAFWAIVGNHLPDWRALRRELNDASLPVG